MKAPTPDDIARYRNDGFVVIPDFLDAGEPERGRCTTDDAVRDRLESTAADADEQNTYYARVFTQCQRLADTHVEMAGIILDPRPRRAGATLSGLPRIRGWHDHALVNPPDWNPTAWALHHPFSSVSSADPPSIS